MTEKTKHSGSLSISGKYIILVTAVFSTAVIALSGMFGFTLIKNSRLIRDVLTATGDSLLMSAALNIKSSIESDQSDSIDFVSKRLAAITKSGDAVLFSVIYKKTSDENYFKAVRTAKKDNLAVIPVQEGTTVKEIKDINFLRKGLSRCTVDPAIYSRSPLYWQNIYIPVRINDREHVIQLFISSAATVSLMNDYESRINSFVIFLSIAAVLIMLTVAGAGGWLYYNFNLLISGLSRTMKKAASGDLNVHLNDNTSDPALAELAASFNELVEEFKDAKSRPVQEPAAAPEPAPAVQMPVEAPPVPAQPIETKELFARGVALIKEGRVADSIEIFKVITQIKPDSFASYFNLGVAYAKTARYHEALAVFEEALRINPAHEQSSAYSLKIQNILSNE